MVTVLLESPKIDKLFETWLNLLVVPESRNMVFSAFLSSCLHLAFDANCNSVHFMSSTFFFLAESCIIEGELNGTVLGGVPKSVTAG